ncbi:Na+/H+ antiporter subunit G [Pseudorhodobacter sp. MZDSW-24AT]|uniref:Na+/H+ antiporter subunit G n=1 Tax=Pseudorhodobacter sp. MZDSW-24AT TaxID=2052957 RepID=UPI000C1E6D8C|nr:Na+/H+ antiporter subunit G [Pseudorhodobacter sp. MZDSW-24AT]PJF08356.1 Na+/H+ antiporter subunit G [Pseudorhodobacter sp. MZDSW-24AT]
MDQIVEYLLAALLVIGGLFAIVGSFGLLKLPTMMQRLHAPTKATTVGVGSALIASMSYFWYFEGTLSWHELMITLFLFLTAPITANFIAKAQLHRAINKEDLPPTGVGKEWATYDPEVTAVSPVLLNDRDPG